MVAIAKKMFPQIEFKEGDAQNLPFANASFDRVLANFALLHLADPQRAITEAFRVLKPGGKFGFTVWARPSENPYAKIIDDAIHAHANVDVDLPVAPSKLIAVGLNYADHIAEMKRTPLGSPLIWFKAPSSLLRHNGTIEIAFPQHQTDFETELAAVIGATAKNVSSQSALDHVFGYTIGLDISDRDLQKSEKQFSRCKSFDTYTPVGPFVYADVDVNDLAIELRLNGEIKQRARTSQMIYSVAQIVSFASQSLTLASGDVVLTGTPSGVGPIRDGDELEAKIGDWPPLRNGVKNAR